MVKIVWPALMIVYNAESVQIIIPFAPNVFKSTLSQIREHANGNIENIIIIDQHILIVIIFLSFVKFFNFILR